MDGEQVRNRKEVVVAYSRYCACKRLRKTTIILSIAGIRSRYLWNTFL